MISHNLALIGQNCHRILITYAGRIVEEVASDELSHAYHPYTRALLGAVPDMSQPLDQPLTQISGASPDIHARPSGCAFHPRCPLAEEICRNEVPPLESRGGMRRVACWVANRELAAASQ
jgi:oligopeptide/dipeptide ABC transporter ATP-binding protein